MISKEQRMHKQMMKGVNVRYTCPNCHADITMKNGYGHRWCGQIDCNWGVMDTTKAGHAVAVK